MAHHLLLSRVKQSPKWLQWTWQPFQALEPHQYHRRLSQNSSLYIRTAATGRVAPIQRCAARQTASEAAVWHLPSAPFHLQAVARAAPPEMAPAHADGRVQPLRGATPSHGLAHLTPPLQGATPQMPVLHASPERFAQQTRMAVAASPRRHLAPPPNPMSAIPIPVQNLVSRLQMPQLWRPHYHRHSFSCHKRRKRRQQIPP